MKTIKDLQESIDYQKKEITTYEDLETKVWKLEDKLDMCKEKVTEIKNTHDCVSVGYNDMCMDRRNSIAEEILKKLEE